MKQIYLSLLVILFAGTLIAQPRIFVKQDATGANDGSSWGDAYIDLQSALDDSSSPDIWIAAGIYVPGAGSTDSFSTFLVNRQVNIIGGFAGTEMSPDDRKTDVNKTILSGDLGGDDVIGNNDVNRTDNALHVMVIDSGSLSVTLDALTVTGGQNLAFNPDVTIAQFLRRGAGIYAINKVQITNCDFFGNVGGGGSAVSVRTNAASGSIIQNCSFSKNIAFDQAVVYLWGASDLEVKDCKFTDNQNNRGALYPNECTNVTVSNCEFNANTNPGGFGGALFNWHTINLDLVNCQFIGNTAGNAGAIYSDYRNFDFSIQNTDNFLIQDCMFEGNTSSDWGGGAIYAFKSSFQALSTTFTKNESPNTGGAIYNGGTQKRTLISGCTFEGNEAGGGWGGGIANYGDTTLAIIENTVFKNNIAITSGAGATSAFGADVTYEGCTFEGNSARFGAGIFSQSDYTTVTVKNTKFSANTADDNGGGMNISGGQNVIVENSSFEGNEAPIGAGLSMGEDSLDLSLLNLSATVFNFNLGGSQGGAINIGNANSNITNCLFVNNIASDVGTGGALSMNASGPNPLNVSVTNSTFVDNSGSLAGGIATWTTDTTAADLFLLNNAFLNGLAPNYAVEAGNTMVQSMGGNFSDNASTDAILTHTMDINNSSDDPMLVDAFNFDYHLLPGSPLVNAGITQGAPMTDLDGNQRDGTPDIGSYELQSVDVNDISEDDKSLTLMPNPVIFKTTLTVENDWNGEFSIEILDVSGKKMKEFLATKITEKQNFSIEVSELQKGIHFLLLRQNGKAISKRMVKL